MLRLAGSTHDARRGRSAEKKLWKKLTPFGPVAKNAKASNHQ